MNNFELIVHTDGGSRGNPGPGACGYVVEKSGEILLKGAKYLGKVTNNFAEYSGVITVLELLTKNEELIQDVEKITFVLDSELVVRQLNGIYKVKDLSLQKLYMDVKNLLLKISAKVVFTNVLRSENKLADQLLNEELDKKASQN